MIVWYLFLAVIVFFFILVVFTKGKLKEYALYLANGDVLHVFRRAQSWWFDFPGQMVYQKENGKRVIVGTHWYLRIEELVPGEWAKIADELKKRGEQESS